MVRQSKRKQTDSILEGEASGPISNSISVLAIKGNTSNYFVFPLTLLPGRITCLGKTRSTGTTKNQNNIIMVDVGMAGNLYFTDVLLEQF